jgi:hypothetical protein
MKKTAFLVLLGVLLASFVGHFPGWFDSGEFAAASSNLGVSHASGHPAYQLIANLFTFLPVGSVAFRTGLVSVFGAVLAVGFLFGISMALGLSRTTAWIIACLPLLHPSVALQITRTEVYSPQYAILLALILLGLDLVQRKDIRTAFLISFLSGYSICLQPLLTVAFLPALLVPIFVNRTSHPRIIALSSLFLGLGLLTYLYVPLRAVENPIPNWDGASNFSQFLKLVMAKDFSVFFHSPVSSRGWKDWLSGDLLKLMPLSVLGFVILGLCVLGTRAEKGVMLFFGSTFLLSFVPWLAKDFHLQNPDSHAYVMLPISLSMILLYIGTESLSRRFHRIFPALLLLLILSPFFSEGVNALSNHGGDEADLLSRHLDHSPPQTSIEVGSDHWLFPIWYRTYVEGRRPDVAIVSRSLVNASWYRNEAVRLYGDVRKRAIWEETSQQLMRTPAGFLIGSPPQSAHLTGSFLKRCSEIAATDPFGISSSVCAKTVLVTSNQTALDEKGVAFSIGLLERSLGVHPSQIRCFPLRSFILPFPLDQNEEFLPSPGARVTSLSRFYLGCGKETEALRLLRSREPDLNGALIRSALESKKLVLH